ncbi:hypothetical protein OHA63_02910 [Streptomyces anulatus]|uniref:hypothetical protein n=1 Tax=Streptomyces anulatus TaxID=1892 RepID=UPI002E359CE3|nr:hypothetical protein [Streptomyces anulatus]
MSRNHYEAPVLDALAAYHGRGELRFSPPGIPAVLPGDGSPRLCCATRAPGGRA